VLIEVVSEAPLWPLAAPEEQEASFGAVSDLFGPVYPD